MKGKPKVGIATDGTHKAKERLTRFRAVDLSSGMELFSDIEIPEDLKAMTGGDDIKVFIIPA